MPNVQSVRVGLARASLLDMLDQVFLGWVLLFGFGSSVLGYGRVLGQKS